MDDTKNMATKAKKNSSLESPAGLSQWSHHLWTASSGNQGIVPESQLSILWTSVDCIIPFYRFEINSFDLLTPFETPRRYHPSALGSLGPNVQPQVFPQLVLVRPERPEGRQAALACGCFNLLSEKQVKQECVYLILFYLIHSYSVFLWCSCFNLFGSRFQVATYIRMTSFSLFSLHIWPTLAYREPDSTSQEFTNTGSDLRVLKRTDSSLRFGER